MSAVGHSQITQHYRLPPERPFLAGERSEVTILLGGLTETHDRLIRAVFEGNGYRCQNLPTPDRADYQVGREYGNLGQCNPTYFTAGNLVRFLRQLEAGGLSREEIARRYVFFTAGTCGPCRFGMYEAEYRMVLRRAGFDQFRVLLFLQNDGVRASSEPGLHFSLDFGLGMMNALQWGDALQDLLRSIRPYELTPGATDAAYEAALAELGRELRERRSFDITSKHSRWPQAWREARLVRSPVNTLGKLARHWRGEDTRRALAAARARLAAVEVDRLRVRPVVKITGEFWAQTTNGDGNFHLFSLLEREGAEVLLDPLANWVLYLLYQAQAEARRARWLERGYGWGGDWQGINQARRRLGVEWRSWTKAVLFGLASRLWTWQYDFVRRALGGGHRLAPQAELARLAEPFYNPLARGGEGHLEVAKNLYYSRHRLAHMVLAIKPFGCMPSTQSDGVQAAVVRQQRGVIFLSIETAGEGEVHAHSRALMALGEARQRARAEFNRALQSTGRSLEEIRGFVAVHPPLRSALYPLPRVEGVAGMAAQFALHVSDLMAGRARLRKVAA